jgi:hypothetical protein
MHDFRLRTALFWAVAQRVVVFLTDMLRKSPEELSSSLCQFSSCVATLKGGKKNFEENIKKRPNLSFVSLLTVGDALHPCVFLRAVTVRCRKVCI